MRQKRRLQRPAVVMVGMALGVGCGGGGISREEAALRAEELQADMWTGAGGEAVRQLRELLARPPDGPLRDSATALVGEIEGLLDEVIAVRTELLQLPERAPEPEEERSVWSIGPSLTPDPVRMAEVALELVQERMEGSWPEIRADLEGETIEAVDKGMRGAARAKGRIERELEAARATLARIRGG